MIDLNYEKNITFIADHYGETEQLIQTAEECSELSRAALKLRRAYADPDADAETLRSSVAALYGEIADVLIMCEQLMYLEGCGGDVMRIVGEKLARQMERIKAGNGQEVSG